MNEEQLELFICLKRAIHEVYNEHRLLFENRGKSVKGLEQAFAFRVGVHLSRILVDTKYATFDLDSEYNKRDGDIKVTTNFGRGIRPDLLLHVRNSDRENKLAIEFKGWWNKKVEKDHLKLCDLTDPNGQYKYLLGVFVHVGETWESTKMTCFNDGTIYE